jgi:hypothetical protein
MAFAAFVSRVHPEAIIQMASMNMRIALQHMELYRRSPMLHFVRPIYKTCRVSLSTTVELRG